MAIHRFRLLPTPSVSWIISLDSNDRTKCIGPVVEEADPINTHHTIQLLCTVIAQSAKSSLILRIGRGINRARELVKGLRWHHPLLSGGFGAQTGRGA